MNDQFGYDDIQEARRKSELRRRAVLRQKAKRQKKLRTMKAAAVSVAVLTVLTVAFFTIGAGVRKSDKNSDTEENAQVAVLAGMDGNNQADLQKNAKSFQSIAYPQKSSEYKEITDEEVKSPYIALVDVENDEVIAGRNTETKIYPASMTKVMTLIVAVEHIDDLDEKFTFSNDLIHPLVMQQASRAGFDPDEQVKANDLLYGLILPSGADAAVALSTLVAGSEEKFAEMMNEKCKELGLQNTHFVNASGLYSDEQYTTPVEMAMILEYAMQNETCAKILSTYQYTTEATVQHPEGILLTSTLFSRMYGNEVEGVKIIAGKTGYTQEAGDCLVSYAEKNGHHYVALTAGATYKWHVIFDDFSIYGKYLPS